MAARSGCGIPICQARYFTREAKPLGAEFNAQGVDADLGNGIQHLARMRHPAVGLGRIGGGFPGGGYQDERNQRRGQEAQIVGDRLP